MSICVVALLAALSSLADTIITENVTLDADADWSADGTVTIAEGVTVNLGGHTLKVKGLECNGSIIDDPFPGYTRVAYIESSGTQWINTGFVTTENTAIECDFTTLNNNDNRAVFCGDWANYGHLFVLNTNGMNFFGTSNKLSNFVAYKHFRIQTIPGGSNTVVLYDGDTGAEVASSNVALTHSGTGEMTLFAAREDGYQPALARIHAFKLTHEGTVVRDMVPVVRDADGEAGLYDRANGTFYTNAGTGVFAAGEAVRAHLAIDISGDAAYSVAGTCDVSVVAEGATLSGDVDLTAFGNTLKFDGAVYLNRHTLTLSSLSGTDGIFNIPGVYRRLAYIEADGLQWINTGFVTTAETAIECDFTTCGNNANRALFCGDWAQYGHLFVFNTTGLRFFGTDNKLGNFVAYKHFKVQTIPGGSKTVILYDGDTGAEVGSSNIALTHSGMGEMILFAARADGYQPAYARMHSFKMTLQGTVIRDMVPVERTADGKAGMYDLANDTFYPSIGTEDFLKGPSTGEFYGLTDEGDAGTLRLEVAEGETVQNDSAALSGNVVFAKSGAGEYVERVAQENTGGVTIEGGTLVYDFEAPVVQAPITFAGGTLAIEDGRPVTAAGGVAVTAPSGILFRRGENIGRKAAINGFGAETPLAQLSLTVTPVVAVPASFALDGNDLLVELGGANDVVKAVWTGTEDGDVTKPANWLCTNAADEQVADGLPAEYTSVYISGNVAPQFPVASGFKCAEVFLGDCTLTADCDWRGLGELSIAGTLDLAGHKLYTAGVTGEGTVLSGDANGYRYYRFKVDATGGNDFQISNIDMGYGGTTLMGRQKTILWRTDNFPSQFNPSCNPEKAFDGNTATKWYDNRSKDDIWATVDFEEPVMVTYYSWWTGDDTNSSAENKKRNPTAWRLQASNDNATWTDLDVVEGASVTTANKTLAYTGRLNTNLGCDGGELHIDVAEGICQTNSSVTLAGRLKLVKEGAGTLVLAKAGQTYGGGTLIAAGTLKPGLTLDDTTVFGAACSTMTVAEGAQFLDDVYCLGSAKFLDWVISGDGPDGTGAIRATARTPGRNNAQVAWCRSVTLADDATIGSDEYAFDFIADNYMPLPITLNGHTLTLKSSRPMNQRQYPFFLASSMVGMDEGTIVVGENLCFYPYKENASVLSNVTLVVSANAEYNTGTDSNARDLTVSNLVYRSVSTGSNTKKLTTVLGTYTPASTTSAPKVQLGDAQHLSVGLDLSELTSEYDVAFGGGLTFTEGAQVKVNLGSRKRHQAERLVAWTERPVGVTFKGASRYDSFEVRDDGLYLASGTLVIIR